MKVVSRPSVETRWKSWIEGRKLDACHATGQGGDLNVRQVSNFLIGSSENSSYWAT
jgi:hypothetical protein